MTVTFGTTFVATVVKSTAICSMALLAVTSAYTRDLTTPPIPATTLFPWEVAEYFHSKLEKRFCVLDNLKRK